MKEINCNFLNINQAGLNLNHVIRIGSIRDGGYFVTKRMVDDCSFIISGGISYNVAFEKDFWDINRNAKLIMIDGSFNIFTYLLRPFYWMLFKRSFLMKIGGLIDMLYLKRKAVFLKKYLGSGITLNQIFNEHTGKEKGYLKLDIEGSEYELLDEIITLRSRLNGVAIEFHEVPGHIPAIRDFIAKLQMTVISFNINEVGGLNAENIPNVIELCFADDQYVSSTEADIKSGKRFSNEFYNELLIPTFCKKNIL